MGQYATWLRELGYRGKIIWGICVGQTGQEMEAGGIFIQHEYAE